MFEPLSGTKTGIYAGSCHLTAQNAVNYSTLCAVYVQFLNARCFHMFLTFFHKKQRSRLKLDDSVTRKKAGWRSRTKAFAHTGAFTQKSLHKGAFYTQKVLHREVFTLRSFCTQTSRSFFTQKFLHEEIFTQRGFYTQTRLHTEAFTQRSLYTEELLHTKAFTHSKFLHTQGLLQREVFTQRSFLHTEGFTQRSLYSKELLHTNV